MKNVSKDGKGRSGKRTIFLVVFIIVLGLLSWHFLRPKPLPKSSDDTNVPMPATTQSDGSPSTTELAKGFIGGMQTSSKAAVDGIMSDSFKATVKQESGTESFYDACHKEANQQVSCLKYFTTFELAKVRLAGAVSASAQNVTLCAPGTVDGKALTICYDFHFTTDAKQLNDLQTSTGSPNS